MRLSPRSEAIAYRIWAYANPLGWDCTVGEAADALDVHVNAVRSISKVRGWLHRFRVTKNDWNSRTVSVPVEVFNTARDFISELHLEGASE